MKVAIIDDGVSTNYYSSVTKLANDLEVVEENVVPRRPYDSSIRSHGTVSAAILLKYAPAAEIVSIKVIDKYSGGERKNLIHALKWCLRNDIRLVNLSIGSTHYRDYIELQALLHELIGRGMVIVAAKSNMDIFTMPACMMGVIGVKATSELENGDIYLSGNELFDVPFRAKAVHTLHLCTGGVELTDNVNSFASPYVTAVVYNIVTAQNPSGSGKVLNKLQCICANGHRKGVFSYSTPVFGWRSFKPVYASADGYNRFCEDQQNLPPRIFLDDSEFEERNLLFIPNKNSDGSGCLLSFLEYLNSINLTISGLIYAGELSDSDKERLLEHNVWLWSETDYINALENMHFFASEPTIPILHIPDSGVSIDHATKMLREIFGENGYNARIVSDKELAYLSDMDYLPNSFDCSRYISFIEEKMCLDVAIVLSKHPNLSTPPDIVLSFDDDIIGSSNTDTIFKYAYLKYNEVVSLLQ